MRLCPSTRVFRCPIPAGISFTSISLSEPLVLLGRRHSLRFFKTIRNLRVSFLLILLAAAAIWMAGNGEGSQGAFASNSKGSGAQASLPHLEQTNELKTPGPVSSVLWSSDGSKLAAYSLGPGADMPTGGHLASPLGSLITIWHADGQVFRKLSRPQPFFWFHDTFAFVAGDKQIVAPASMTSDSLAFSVFDIESSEIVREIPGAFPDKPRNVNAATVMAASPDQSLLAVTFGAALAQPVALYSTRDWTKLADLPDGPANGAERPYVLAFSQDGKFLAVNKSRFVLIYDVNSRQVIEKINVLPDEFGTIGSLAFSPDNALIAVGLPSVADRRTRPDGSFEVIPPKDLVRVFSTRDGSRVATYGERFYPVYGVTWSPDGPFVAFTTQYRSLHIWNPFLPARSERRIELSSTRGSSCLAFSPDGRWLAAGVGQNVRTFSITP
jgi:WD40 repeat protein